MGLYNFSRSWGTKTGDMPEALILDCVTPSRVYLLEQSIQIHGT